MSMFNITDIQEYMPDVLDYGIQDFDDVIEKTRQDIFRRLRIDWWLERSANRVHLHIQANLTIEMDETKLDEEQFTRAAVFYSLAYYILPRLTKFNPDGDQFSIMMKHYKERYQEEWDYILRDGVKYDDNNDSVYETHEKVPVNAYRLVR